MMRVLFFGDRNWTDFDKIRQCLAAVYRVCPDAIIVHGAARGADSIAGHIATEIFGPDHVEAHPADWNQFGRAAGPLRNQAMITISAERAANDGHNLRMAFGFHSDIANSRGTKDMKSRLDKARILNKIVS